MHAPVAACEDSSDCGENARSSRDLRAPVSAALRPRHCGAQREGVARGDSAHSTCSSIDCRPAPNDCASQNSVAAGMAR
eukprot:4407407-Pleurochrysis_carterae.AAC.4